MATWMSVRLTPHDCTDAFERLKAVCGGEYGGGYLIVHENSSSGVEHYHAVVHCDNAKKFQNALTRGMKGYGGNKYFSTKNCTADKDAAIRYICKGSSEHPHPRGDPPDVVGRSGLYFTDDRIRESYESYWTVSEKTKKSKELGFPQQVVNYMKINNLDITWENAVSATVDMTISLKKPLCTFYCKKVAQYIVAAHNTDYCAALKRSIVRSGLFDDV